MYASSEKKLDILNDHYKDTFSHLVSYRKQRDRLLLYMVGVLMILFLYQFFPGEIVDTIFTTVSNKTGVDMELGFIEKHFLIFTPTFVFYFVAGRRYWQVWHLIDKQYDYLEEIEKELSSLYASGLPFTRESKFSYKGKNLSIWSNTYYNQICYAIVMFVLPALGATFGIRHYGFKLHSLIIGLMGTFVFVGPQILRKLSKRQSNWFWGIVGGVLITAMVIMIVTKYFF